MDVGLLTCANLQKKQQLSKLEVNRKPALWTVHGGRHSIKAR